MAEVTIEKEPCPPDSTLIVGAGIAGLYTALKMAPRPVIIITASTLGTGGASTWAQGGLAAAIGSDDSPDLHLADTLTAGAGLVDEPAARALVEEGPDRVHDLVQMGIEFDAGPDGEFLLGREAAHQRNRIIHATGDQAGAAIMDGLIKAARQADHITIRERITAEELILTDDKRCFGVLAFDIAAQKRLLLTCPRTVLATGGIGGLFAVTTNPTQAQGHGLAMAFRAGAEIMDPEFVQFHPTALNVGIDPAPLATEALRGEGAKLVNRRGRSIMAGVHLDTDLAPRDIVARTVATSINNGNGAYLDATSAIGAAFPDRFPTVFTSCEKVGIDPRTQPIPVAPAAHYHMGGIRTDEYCRTNVSGLWAVGEVANSGVHGANRLASNSLLEALVFGHRCAQSTLTYSSDDTSPKIGVPGDRLPLAPAPASAEESRPLRDLMSQHAGLIRNRAGVAEALAFVHEKLADPQISSGFKNALITASLILGGANNRMESRGSHYRQDYPSTGNAVHGIMYLDTETGAPKYRTAPIRHVTQQEGAA